MSSRRQRRRSRHDHKAPLHVSGADMANKVLVLEGEDKPLDPNATINLVTAGKNYPDGKPRFVVRDSDPMRAFTVPHKGGVTLPITEVLRARLNAVKRPGESDDDTIARFFDNTGKVTVLPGTPEFEVADEIAAAVQRAGPLHLAPHGTRERLASEGIESVLKAIPSKDRIPTLLKVADGYAKKSMLNSSMSALASERLRGALGASGRDVGELLDGKSDSYAIGGLAAVRNALTEPDAIKKLDQAVSTLLLLERNGFDGDQRRRLVEAREARDPTAVRVIIDERLKEIEKYQKDQKGDVSAISGYLDVLEEVAKMVKDPVLGKVTDSCFHKVVEAWRSREMLIPMDALMVPTLSPAQVDGLVEKLTHHDVITETGIFLLQHDWASAFAKAEGFDGGEIHLPYKQSVYECMISGHRVCVSIAYGSVENPISILHAQIHGRWSLLGTYRLEHGTLKIRPEEAPDMCTALMEKLATQIRAICIALEAEVAITEVIRAPHRLNQKRERQGRLPLHDYHVVSLANRTRHRPRLPSPGDIDEEHRHRRLHWVRGHWRHHTNIKSWIKWHLRGDPDLGFVDKEYRL